MGIPSTAARHRRCALLVAFVIALLAVAATPSACDAVESVVVTTSARPGPGPSAAGSGRGHVSLSSPTGHVVVVSRIASAAAIGSRRSSTVQVTLGLLLATLGIGLVHRPAAKAIRPLRSNSNRRQHRARGPGACRAPPRRPNPHPCHRAVARSDAGRLRATTDTEAPLVDHHSHLGRSPGPRHPMDLVTRRAGRAGPVASTSPRHPADRAPRALPGRVPPGAAPVVG